MKSKVFNYFLTKLEIHPVLVDIGASGSLPKIWDEIASYSVYIGFEPDEREISNLKFDHFSEATIINRAVTSEKDTEEVEFYLTKYPFCSSTLNPDYPSISNYLFSNLFKVERKIKVPSTSLNSVINRHSLPGIDWLKTDSQGTDLRLFNSLNSEIRSKVLAVDIEPGLIDAYVGEDLFVDAHQELTRNGFWLSDLIIGGAVRMNRANLQKFMALDIKADTDFFNHAMKQSPVCCNARYLRTIDWLAQGKFDRRGYVLLWIFSLLDNQVGFGLDLSFEYESVFGLDEISQRMKDVCMQHFMKFRDKKLSAKLKSFLPVPFKRWLKGIFCGGLLF